MQSCLSKSTAHGLGNIGNEHHTSGKLIWLVLTILTLACFIYHTNLLHNQLLEEQVLVSTHPEAKPFLQPDIVFCPERFFARDFINHPPKDEFEHMLNVSRQIQRFNVLFNQSSSQSTSIIWDSLDTYQLYKAFFQRKHQLFLSVMCNFAEVNVDDIAVEMNFIHFACFRLKSTSCPLTSPLDTLTVKFYTHIYGTDINYKALNVLISNKTIDSFLFAQKESIDEMEDGVHVYFVQPNEGINDGTSKQTASVNSHTTIRIRSSEFIRESTKKSECRKTPTFELVYNLLEEDISRNLINVTKESMCMETTFQNMIFQFVACVSRRFPVPISIPRNFTFCSHISKLSSIFDYTWLWNKPGIMEKVRNKCRPFFPCRSVLHSTTVNYNPWPRTSVIRNLFTIDIPKRLESLRLKKQPSPGLSEALADFKDHPTNINAWKRNFLKVSISPGEFMSTVIEESRAYSLKNFFSDTGGIMGFYMGASVLTVFELFRLLHCSILSYLETKKKESTTEDHPLEDEVV